jgi:putative molybdopterin biosynthesis protein
MRLALDQWRALSTQEKPPPLGVLRFAGSHDLALAWLAAHFPEIAPQFTMQLGFCGSLGGLIALAEGNADLAGCHLWDEESDSYNAPFVRRLLPGRRTALLTLAHRRLGLILAAGNPQGIHDLKDLTSPGVKFVNRQSGSGTRVWLDAALHRAGISGKDIWGYEEELITHSDVAATVAGGRAGVGFGLETAARSYGLDFIPLVRERYDLAIPSENIEHPAMGGLISWLSSAAARKTISGFGGYEVEETGEQCWVE